MPVEDAGGVDETEIGEAKVTSKGQITVPGAVRKELGIAAGDRLTFVKSSNGSIIVRPRKYKSIVDFARQNPIRLKKPIKDLDANIQEAVGEAMAEQERRIRRQCQ